MTLLHRLHLADGWIAFQNLIFSSALSSAQRLRRSVLETTITSGLAAQYFPSPRSAISVSEVMAFMAAQHVSNKARGAVLPPT